MYLALRAERIVFMTKQDYTSKVYVGKHEKHEYRVWRVHGPAGPVEVITVHGKQELNNAVVGMWDYEVADITAGEQLDNCYSVTATEKESTKRCTSWPE